MVEIGKWLLLISGLFVLISTHAQESDQVLWASIKLTKKWNNQLSLQVVPIIRFNENLTKYQNNSIDVALRKSFGKNWSLQTLSRTWFLPDASKRQFIWLDLAYNHKWKNIGWENKLRLHHALDLNEKDDPDFLRWKTQFNASANDAFRYIFAIEPWWSLNRMGILQRFRLESGIEYHFTVRVSISLIYRWEKTIKVEPFSKLNAYLVTFGYSIA